MLLGGGVWSLGRRAAVAGLRAAVPRGMAALAAPTATGGAMATGLGRVAARSMDRAGGSQALQSLGIRHAVPKPVVERGAEILGGSTAIGGLYGGDALEEGKDPNEAMRVALMSAGLAAGFETALTVGAKALFPGARERDIGRLLAKTEGAPAYRKQIQTELDGLMDKLNGMQSQLAALHDTPNPNLDAIGKLMLKQQKEEPKLLNEINALSMFRDMSPLFRQYLRDSPREVAGADQTFLLKIAKTPEQLAGELGPAAAKVVKMAQNAQLETTMARSFNNVELREIDRLARAGLGVARRHKGQYLMEAADN